MNDGAQKHLFGYKGMNGSIAKQHTNTKIWRLYGDKTKAYQSPDGDWLEGGDAHKTKKPAEAGLSYLMNIETRLEFSTNFSCGEAFDHVTFKDVVVFYYIQTAFVTCSHFFHVIFVAFQRA